MELKEREEIIKALECCSVWENCDGCTYRNSVALGCTSKMMRAALALIKELTEECKDFKIRALRAENEAAKYKDRWETSKKDFERLADENETLRGLYEYNSKLAIDAEHRLCQYQKHSDDELSRVHMLLTDAWESVETKDKLLEIIKSSTVRKMQEKLKEYLDDFYTTDEDALLDTSDLIDQIAKEVLEENK